ncbi:hypothetical protein ACIF6L_34670 [Kitasatospora sp. NPDC086009]|uniref:hypothetical protein n=1 Tax=unclassified Kitasatospora TaxID=2633591 RepID=UPI0037C636E7
MYNMTEAQMWAALVAFFSPAAIALVQQPGWTKLWRTAVAVVIAAAIGTGSAYFADAFTGRGVVSAILLAVLVSTTAYTTVFKPSGLAPALERATSPRARR